MPGVAKQSWGRVRRAVHRVEKMRGGIGEGPVVSRLTPIIGIVTAAECVGSEPYVQWTYTAKRIIKSEAGYAGWTEDGDDLTAYNMAEDINGVAGTYYGNGLLRADLDTDEWTATLNPAPVGLIVMLMPMPVGELAEYWFCHENSVTLECDEEPAE